MGTREYPERPVAAVGGIIIDRGKVLLIRRGQPPLLGQWSIPGGAVETGAHLNEALRREILEETGLVVEGLGLIEALDRITYDEAGGVRFHYVLLDYLCRVTGGELRALTDASEVCWAARSELPAYALQPETLRVIERG